MLRGFLHLYSWRYAVWLIAVLQKVHYKPSAFLRVFWTSDDIAESAKQQELRPVSRNYGLLWLVRIGSATEILWAISIGYQAISSPSDSPGGLQFALAVLFAFPIVWAHVVALVMVGSYLAKPKYVGRRVLSRIFAVQVRRLRRKHHFKVVAIVGSVGKTSTKTAVAKALGVSKRVLWQEGNYNVDLTVPLVLFGHELPGLFNIPAWIRIWFKNRRIIAQKEFPYDVAVLELGTDEPGQIAQFAYVKPDVVVVTAVSPEHMEFFQTLDAVAEEELTALSFAKKALVNIDDVDAAYLKGKKFISYGLTPKATYHASDLKEKGIKGQSLKLTLGKSHAFQATIPMLGVQGAKMAVAAAAVAHVLDVENADIEKGLKSVEAFAGRMRIFKGIKETTLIDDTYNASPIAVNAALDVVYATKAPQRIAILGSMNELGDYSSAAHQEVGAHCRADKLDLVVTIGHDANTYLAPIAVEQGCTVKTFDSPYAAGLYVKKQLKKGALVLAKGSQNRVFAEESLKQLLLDKHDAVHMVRQSEYWLAVKQKQFSDFIA